MSARILIAEDEDSIVTSLEFLMRRSGFETRIARDGMAALACLEEFRPDLVLLDIMLPRRSGFDVCRAIRATARLRATAC
jgi:DNA-binding response OmpR family regulator